MMARKLKRVLLALSFSALAGWAAFEFAVRSVDLPSSLDGPPPSATLFLDRKGDVFHVMPEGNVRDARPLALREMGASLPAMTVAVEDGRFFSHPGVDPLSISAAILRNARAGRIISGASTITQQLVKLSSGRTRRSLDGKIYEALAAIKLERKWSKDQILEAYLNRLDYGNRRYGPEAASLAYFGKSAADLSLAEALYLAGLPQSPSRLNPWMRPKNAAARYGRNADRLRKSGAPIGAALPASAPAPGHNDPPMEAPAYAGAALREADAGTRILRTALDRDIQTAAEKFSALQLASSRGFRDVAAAVVSVSSGEVVALAVAGPYSSLPGAGNFPRSCGSTLKPFLYARAIDAGRFTAASLLPDIPDPPYRDYQPKNYAGRYYGPVRLREALGNSLNVPAVHVLSQLGARDTFASLRNWGFALPGSFDDYGAGFILGNAPVSPAELAGAYASIARGGFAWKPTFLKTTHRDIAGAASPATCEIIADILCDNRARQTSFGNHSPLALPQRTAAKTGTSSNFRDGWCAGFTRDHAVAAWAGNIDGTPMPELLAVRSAAPLWATITSFLYDRGDRPVPEPALAPTRISRLTGLLPEDGEESMDEYFLPGTEPSQKSSTMFSGGILLLPEAYAKWCASTQNFLRARTAGGSPRILFPPDGSDFEFHPSISANRQAFRPQSTDPSTQWFLDGKPLPGDLVPLSPGNHMLEARSPAGSATSSYRVTSNP